MKIVGDLLSPNDPALVEKTLARINEQDRWNDLFSTKLIELLDNGDLMKSEIRERMRTIESVTQTANQSILEAKGLLNQAIGQLATARALETDAERKHLNAVLLCRAVVRNSAFAVAASWIATIWMAWFTLRPTAPLWAACAISIVLLVAAVLFQRAMAHPA